MHVKFQQMFENGYFAPHKVGEYFTVSKGNLDMYIEEPIFYA